MAFAGAAEHGVNHYFGFAETQWKLFEKEHPRRVKPLLYVYRVLLTGIHLMETGDIEANVLKLTEVHPLPCVSELVARKLAGPEQSTLDDSDFEFHRGQFERLRNELQSAFESSRLPETPSAKLALNDLLLRLRKL